VIITQGWPCQRLNWAWRIVWTTCSINTFVPVSTPETPANIPWGYRTVGPQSGLGYSFNPTNSLPQLGVIQPATVQVNIGGPWVGTFFESDSTPTPSILCQNAPNTGSGVSATVRNRCRRAMDSYGGLVKQCSLPASLAPMRGPNNLSPPDWQPDVTTVPHVANMQALTLNARFCVLPYQTVGALPNVMGGTGGPQAGPAYNCPGLLGWFNVVLNACGFTNNPNLNWPNLNTQPLGWTGPGAASANFPNIFPVQGSAVGSGFSTIPQLVQPGSGATNVVGNQIGSAPNVGFCGTAGAGFNINGVTFRTGRCRKALDQFGRTAGRCNASPMGTGTGPAQAGGYSDPLRLWAIGHSPFASAGNVAILAPDGADAWAPNCN